MEGKEPIKIKLSTAILLLIIILLIILTCYLLIANKSKQLNMKSNNEVNTEINVQTNTQINTPNEDISKEDSELELKLREFLTAKDTIISEETGVGAGYPDAYYFDSNGNFAYSATGEYAPEKNGDLLGYRGTWKIENNKLILNIEKEIKAQDGRLVSEDEDPIQGNHLENYKEEISEVNRIEEYKIDRYVEDTENEKFDYFKFDKIELHQIYLGETNNEGNEYLNKLKKIEQVK